MVSTKLSRMFGMLQRYNRTPGSERSPKQLIEDFNEAADEPSQDRLLESIRFFDESLRALEEDRNLYQHSAQSRAMNMSAKISPSRFGR